MIELIVKLLEIMDNECENDNQWQKNKPTIIEIYVEGDE